MYLCPSTNHNPHFQCHHGRYSSSCALDCNNNPNSYFTHNVRTAVCKRFWLKGAKTVETLQLLWSFDYNTHQNTSVHLNCVYIAHHPFWNLFLIFPKISIWRDFLFQKRIKNERSNLSKVILYAFPHSASQCGNTAENATLRGTHHPHLKPFKLLKLCWCASDVQMLFTGPNANVQKLHLRFAWILYLRSSINMKSCTKSEPINTLLIKRSDGLTHNEQLV